jgi:hypothetical protein
MKNKKDIINQYLETHTEDLESKCTSNQKHQKNQSASLIDIEEIEYRLYNWADELYFMDYSGTGIPKITIPEKGVENAIKFLNSIFPTIDNKIISEIVKKYTI